MPSANTTVHRGSRVPFRVIATNALGNPLPPNQTPPASSANAAIAVVQTDPADNRRFAIRGVAAGSTTVTVGSGANALVIAVDVTSRAPDPDQVSRVDLFAFEPEE